MVHSLTKEPSTTHQVGSPESIGAGAGSNVMYKPQTDVAGINAIAYDQRAIEQLLQKGDAASFDQARQIYVKGAYSSPYAQLVITNDNGEDDNVGLPFAIAKGQKFIGQSMDGTMQVTASAFEKYDQGTNTIWLLYDNDVPCHVGGLAEPEYSGCFNTTGALQLVTSYEQQHGAGAGSGPVVGGAVPTATGNSSTHILHYMYDYTMDNRNERSIQGFSIHANGKFRPNGNLRIPYMDDFQKFVDYYGMYDYADQIITAAFEADNTDNDFVFKRGAFVFAGYSREARREIIARVTAYMATGMFVIREMEHGVFHCDQKCGDLMQLEPDDPTYIPDCMVHPLHSVDSAVALYTGAVQAEDGSGNGNLLYGLAQEQCRAFKTCWNAQTNRHDYIDVGLPAQVNMDIFEQFNELQHHLDVSNCVEAKVNKRHVAQKMFVPLVQGLLQSVYEMNQNSIEHNSEDDHEQQQQQQDVLHARSIAMAAAVLPVLAHCNLGDAQKVYKAIIDGEVEQQQEPEQPAGAGALEHFQLVKSVLENQYHCMGITCQDVGGLVDPATGDYISALTAPCGEPVDKEDTDGSDMDDGVNKGAAFGSMFFIFLAALLLLCCVLYRRRQRRFKKRNYDDDDDDDDSLSSIESFD
jgi:hypothetical protein